MPLSSKINSKQFETNGLFFANTLIRRHKHIFRKRFPAYFDSCIRMWTQRWGPVLHSARPNIMDGIKLTTELLNQKYGKKWNALLLQ